MAASALGQAMHWVLVVAVIVAIGAALTILYPRLRKLADGTAPATDYQRYQPFMRLNIPGANSRAYLMFIPRFVLCTIDFLGAYPCVLFKAMRKAIGMRCRLGTPSQILSHGGYPGDGSMHWPDGGYSAVAVHDQPLDQGRMEDAFRSLVNQVKGLGERKCEIRFEELQEPIEWPSSGSFALHELIPHINPGESHFEYWKTRKSMKARRLHVYNGPPGKPTVVLYSASCFPFDGSSNFNFYKELMSRYVGNPEKEVFQKPEIAPESAAKFDSASFVWFLLKMPWNLARTIGGSKWNQLREPAWAGGNGSDAKLTAMNFTQEESIKLYDGSKALGGSPYSAFTYASVKACHAILGQQPQVIAQQANIQTRHYPLAGQNVAARDLVGEWLVAPVQKLPVCSAYDLAAAERGYQALLQDLNDVGPATRNTFLAKAYGEWNCGAAVFQMSDSYSDCAHPASRSLFFNNYGKRSTVEGAHLVAWLWNAPVWLGVNTININGATTTLIGSSRWGLEVVEAIRDHMEMTLREIMDHAASGDASA